MNPICPKCGRDFVQRAHREALLDRLLSAVFIHPFRCQLCTHRFRRLHWGRRYAKAGSDKRQYQRLLTQIPVSFTGEQIAGEGLTRDISMGGCGLESKTYAPTGTLLQVHLSFVDQEPPVMVEAAAVRMSRANVLGIEFLRLSSQERNRLAQYIRELLLISRRTSH